MKTTFLTLACLLAASTLDTRAQGTIAFGNRVAGLIDAPIFDVPCGGVRVEGPNAFAQLFLGGQAVGSPVAFRTGAGAGYWPTTSVTLPGVDAGAAAVVTVRWWKDAPVYEQAVFWSESDPISVITGGAGSPPTLPAPLIGLTSWCLVPELSPLALGILAACAFGLWRNFWEK